MSKFNGLGFEAKLMEFVLLITTFDKQVSKYNHGRLRDDILTVLGITMTVFETGRRSHA
jgi:hypothetical protein